MYIDRIFPGRNKTDHTLRSSSTCILRCPFAPYRCKQKYSTVIIEPRKTERRYNHQADAPWHHIPSGTPQQSLIVIEHDVPFSNLSGVRGATSQSTEAAVPVAFFRVSAVSYRLESAPVPFWSLRPTAPSWVHVVQVLDAEVRTALVRIPMVKLQAPNVCPAADIRTVADSEARQRCAQNR